MLSEDAIAETRRLLDDGDKLGAQRVMLNDLTSGSPRETREWVHLVEGRYVLTWQTCNANGIWARGGTRPLTYGERVMWRYAAKTPKP